MAPPFDEFCLSLGPSWSQGQPPRLHHAANAPDLAIIALIGVISRLRKALATHESNWHHQPIPLRSTPMPTRNVVLTEHQAGFVEQLVASGPECQ
jgi:hypothetical protein